MWEVEVRRGLRFENQLRKRVESAKLNLGVFNFFKVYDFCIVLEMQRTDPIKAHLNVLILNI